MREAKYIKINEVIQILEKAEKQNIITPRIVEELIYLIYKETDASKYKKP